MAHVRRWWPVVAMLLVAVVVQNAALGRYDVSGHANEHLGSASVPFLATALMGTLLYLTPGARRQVPVLLGAAAWVAGTVVVAVGNVRVVDVLIATGHADTPTPALPDNEAIEAAHGLANAAPWWTVAASLALIGALAWKRHLPARTAAAAAVLTVIFPPWIVPGFGVIIAVASRGRAFHRAATRADPGPTSPMTDRPAMA